MEIKMKIISLCLLLLVISFYLSSDELEQTEQPRYTEEQMDAKAAQFKTETGFKGDIIYNLKNGVFGGIEGTMPSIAVQDTISARICAETLLYLLQPYLRINREQLTISRDYQDQYYYTILLEQQSDHIFLEPMSAILFRFRTDGSNYFSVGSSVIPNLDVRKDNLLTYTEAENRFNKEIGERKIERADTKLVITKYWSEEPLDNNQSVSYKPCWVFNYRFKSDYYGMYIDAMTGKVLRIRKYIPFD
jgi:hypothetical protein